jgi:hypothetical protein
VSGARRGMAARMKFTVYVTADDVGEFAAHVSERGGLFVAVNAPGPQPILLEADEIWRSGVPCLVVPPGTLEQLEPCQLPVGGPRPPPPQEGHVSPVFGLSALEDPVVEFAPSGLRDGGLLSSGRLYFVPDAAGSADFVRKPEAVIEFAADLFGWARTWARRAGGRSCGPSAAARVRAGELTLAPPT